MGLRISARLLSDLLPGNPTEHTGLVDDQHGTVLTYGGLVAEVGRFAAGLVALGMAPGDIAATILGNGAPFAIGFHGTIRAGGAVQPLDPLAPPSEWHRAVRSSGATWLVATAESVNRFAGLAPDSGIRHAILVDDGPAGVPGLACTRWSELAGECPEAIARRPNDLAVLASSSGTEGAAKLVVLTHANLATNLEQIHARYRLDPDDVAVGITPWRHIYGMQKVMNLTLRCGATLLNAASPFRLSAFLGLVERERATVAYLVPAVISELVNHRELDRYDLSALGLVMTGGTPLPADLGRMCRERLGVRVVQAFGMTETGCTHVVPDGVDAPIGSVGQPLPDTDVRITDPDTGRVLPAGAEGELWVRGPQISPGYLGDAGGPLAPDGWLRTGDLAVVDTAGFCTITGRRKELIKYKGHQVAPAELEALLLEHPAVADAGVVGVPDPACGELPKAFVVLNHPIDLAVLTDHVRARVPPQRQLRLIEEVDELPRGETGKLLRQRLRAIAEGQR